MPVVTLSNPRRPLGNNICTCCALDRDVIAAPEFLEAIVEELEQGWRAGCRACKLRYQVALEFQAAPEDSFQFYGLHTFSMDHGDSWELFRPHGDLRADVAAIPVKSVLPGCTNSQATFWTIQGWLQNCLMDHDDCTEFQSSFTPTRLVEVGEVQVTLREGLQNISYACLSHCWGASQSTIRTLTSNIDDFKRSIPWENLSRTFQDAVDICRRLDIQYIWIDSLCIIQDSEQDWKHESLTMASVYENAFITIAATKSPDGAGGCYSNHRANDTFTVAFEGSDVLLRRKPAWLNHFNRHDTWPLLTRGWVFQEMHLSPRVLHFGRDEVIWQCRTCRLSESGSNESTARSTLDRSDGPQVGATLPVTIDWYDAVSEYSRLDFTYEKDRLIALSAISQREAQTRNLVDGFLMGLWRDTLVHDLLWETSSSNFGKTRPRTYGKAPTWSWASLIGHVSWTHGQDVCLLDCTSIRDVCVEYSGAPFIGDCEEAIITLSGPLISTSILSILGAQSVDTQPQEGVRLVEGIHVVRYIPDYQSSTQPDIQVSVLPLAIQKFDHVTRVMGIVIAPDQEMGKTFFKRIGLASLTDGSPLSQRLTWDIPGLSKMLSQLPRKIVSLIWKTFDSFGNRDPARLAAALRCLEASNERLDRTLKLPCFQGGVQRLREPLEFCYHSLSVRQDNYLTRHISSVDIPAEICLGRVG